MSSDAIGEYYCLSELLLAGKEAYLANGLTQKGWDIVVLNNKKIIRVQVKCINWKSEGQAAIKGTFYKQEFDYLVIIILNFKGTKFTSFIFPHEKLKEKKEKDRSTLIDNEGYIYFSKRKQKSNIIKKQTIAISTIKIKEVLALFNEHTLNYESIA